MYGPTYRISLNQMCINSLENGIRTFTLTHVDRHGHSHRIRKQCRCETSHRQTSYLSAGSYGTRSAEGNRRITNATTNKAMTNRNKRLCRSAGSGEIPLGLSLEHMVHLTSELSDVFTSANSRNKPFR
jgi:hypothetical protein